MPGPKHSPMLKESDVIEAVCVYLKWRGWTIASRCNECEQGDDIVAHGPNKEAATIEAKGETSSKAGTARHGKVFNSNQVRHHIANAFYRAAQAVGTERRSGVALPDNKAHRRYAKRILAALKLLGITVFWVSRNGDVSIDDHGNWLPGSESGSHKLFLLPPFADRWPAQG